MRFAELSVGERPLELDPLDAVVAFLRDGGLLVHPTSGVYGIGGLTTASDAVVARMKGRDESQGIVRLVADRAAATGLFPRARWTQDAIRLADTFWPGPLTLVLPDGTERGVALRAEPHPATRAVLTRLGGSLGSSSLNLGGAAPAADADAARRVLEAMEAPETPVLFLDAGSLPGPPPSTLVRVPGQDGQRIEILRSGAADPDRIRAALEEGAR